MVNKFRVIDSESDGLAYEATKLYILGWTDDGVSYHHTTNYSEMVNILSEPDTLFVAHNAIMHDMPLFNRLLGTNLTYKKFVDTLAISRYIHFNRQSHGLESYGEDYGVAKPEVNDWQNITPELAIHRVTEDVKINWLLWCDLKKKLETLYAN